MPSWTAAAAAAVLTIKEEAFRPLSLLLSISHLTLNVRERTAATTRQLAAPLPLEKHAAPPRSPWRWPSAASATQTQVGNPVARLSISPTAELDLMTLFFLSSFLSFQEELLESGLSVLSLESGETHPALSSSSDKVSVRHEEGWEDRWL